MPGHVFLSHAGVELDLAIEFKHALQQAGLVQGPEDGREPGDGLRVWLDADELSAGKQWVAAIESAIQEAVAFVVLIDRIELRRWVTEEIELALRRAVEPGTRGTFALIPILGPNAPADALAGLMLGNRQALRYDSAQGWGPVAQEVANRIKQYTPDDWFKGLLSGSPFKRLDAFGEEDGLLFHGRSRDVERLVERLRNHDLVPVIGNSGSGKSSLVQAGLIPALLRGRFHSPAEQRAIWRLVVFRPSPDPFENLATALCDRVRTIPLAGQPNESLKEALRGHSQSTRPVHDMLESASNPGEWVLLVVDQLEELLQVASRNSSAHQRSEVQRFVRGLVDAAGFQGNRNVKVVTTLRTDYLQEVIGLGFEEFAQASEDSPLIVRLPAPEELRSAIVGPTYLTGRRFAPVLVDRLLKDAGRGAGSLALLQFVLSELWTSCNQSEIGLDAYEQLGKSGKLAGALDQYSDKVLQTLEGKGIARDLIRRMLLKLCVPGEANGHTRRTATRSELIGSDAQRPQRERMLEELIRARLVVGRDDGIEAPESQRYEVPHEELLRSWKTMAMWIQEGADDLRLERSFAGRRQEWLEHGRHGDYCLTPGQLEDARAWARRDAERPGSELKEFFDACHEHHRREARLQIQSRLAVAMPALAVVVGLLVWLWIMDREMNRKEVVRSARVSLLERHSEVSQDSLATDSLRSEASELWPPYPEMIPRLEDWTQQAEELLGRLNKHCHALAALEVESERDPLLEAALKSLIRRLESLEDPEHGLLNGVDKGLSPTEQPGEGPGISCRLAFARTVTERTIASPEAVLSWNALLSDFRGKTPAEFPEQYRHDLNVPLASLQPILGLVPWRRDPTSGLWELLHVASGDLPKVGSRGEFVETDTSGIVLVLVPGGRYMMGSQSGDEQLPNYDPMARPNEGPVHEEVCSPFLIGKTTINQAQWARMSGSNPSRYSYGHSDAPLVGPTNPIESVSWEDASKWLRRYRLQLPRESMMEYVIRGGSASPWFCGTDPKFLLGSANIADLSIGRFVVSFAAFVDVEGFDDGFPVHASASGFVANRFGLYHVVGNVWQWCACASTVSYDAESDSRMYGERASVPLVPRVIRGGSYAYGAAYCRSAYRGNMAPDTKHPAIGVRAALELF